VSWGHGWQPIGLPMLVTAVDGLLVEEINGRPAVEVFLEQSRIGNSSARSGSSEPRSTAHPVGLLQPDGSHVVRVWTVRDGSRLSALAPLPLFAPIHLLSATPEDLVEACDDVVSEVLAGRDAGVVLGFSCAGRKHQLGERIVDEAARFQAAAGDVPTFGMYAFGEYARSTSSAGYHNASVAALAL
jgi:hypothetical protein